MNPLPVDAAHARVEPSAARLPFEERLAMLRCRRRSQSAHVAVQVPTWVTSGLGLVLLAVLIETGR